MPTKEEILKIAQKEVAIAHGIGTSLVIGHRKAYYDEAAFSAMETYAQQQLADLTQQLGEKEREIDKYKALIEKAHYIGWVRQYGHINDSWSDFKTKHNL